MELVIKKSENKDWDFIRLLRNQCSDGFFSNEEITTKEHELFMSKHGENHLIAFGESGERIGFIGHVRGDVRLAVSPEHRKKGVAKKMLKCLIDFFPETKMRAQAKKGNEASINTFLSLGWKKKFECVILENE
mgnify:FL=1|tara:strand:- start:14908 stop:15306 length:399 start_codon:yes stop_codon:yes gene_type:complete